MKKIQKLLIVFATLNLIFGTGSFFIARIIFNIELFRNYFDNLSFNKFIVWSVFILIVNLPCFENSFNLIFKTFYNHCLPYNYYSLDIVIAAYSLIEYA